MIITPQALRGIYTAFNTVFNKAFEGQHPTFAASEEFYHFGAYTIYQGFASDIEVGSKAAQGAKVYLRCSTSTRCSTNAKGGAAE